MTVLIVETDAGPQLQITGATGKSTMRNERLVETSPEVKDHISQVMAACGAMP